MGRLVGTTVILSQILQVLAEGFVWSPLLLPLLFWASADVRIIEGDAVACADCRYPRAGLAPDSPCPECGGASFAHAVKSRVVEWSLWPLIGMVPVYLVSVLALATSAVLGTAAYFNSAEPWPTAWGNAWYLLAPNRMSFASAAGMGAVAIWLISNVIASPRQAAFLVLLALAAAAVGAFVSANSPGWYESLPLSRASSIPASEAVLLVGVMIVVGFFLTSRIFDTQHPTTHIWARPKPRS